MAKKRKSKSHKRARKTRSERVKSKSTHAKRTVKHSPKAKVKDDKGKKARTKRKPIIVIPKLRLGLPWGKNSPKKKKEDEEETPPAVEEKKKPKEEEQKEPERQEEPEGHEEGHGESQEEDQDNEEGPEKEEVESEDDDEEEEDEEEEDEEEEEGKTKGKGTDDKKEKRPRFSIPKIRISFNAGRKKKEKNETTADTDEKGSEEGEDVGKSKGSVEEKGSAEGKKSDKAKAPDPELRQEMTKQIIVADVMSEEPVIFRDNDRINYVVRVFSKEKIDGAPVLKDEQVIGIITKEDIVAALGVKDLLQIGDKDIGKLESMKTVDVMKKRIPVVKRYTKVATATQIMSKYSINILPVVDDKKRIIGVVSKEDVVKEVSKEIMERMSKKTEEQEGSKTMRQVQTEIDILLDTVEKEGSATISSLHERMNIPAERIEDWGKILDREGLIDLFYPPFGPPLLRKRIRSGTLIYPEEEF